MSKKSTVVGFVEDFEGQFYTVDKNGKKIELQNGDEITEGMVIVGDESNPETAQIKISSDSGDSFVLDGVNETVLNSDFLAQNFGASVISESEDLDRGNSEGKDKFDNNHDNRVVKIDTQDNSETTEADTIASTDINERFQDMLDGSKEESEFNMDIFNSSDSELAESELSATKSDEISVSDMYSATEVGTEYTTDDDNIDTEDGVDDGINVSGSLIAGKESVFEDTASSSVAGEELYYEDDVEDEFVIETDAGDDVVVLGDDLSDEAVIDTGDGDDTVYIENDAEDNTVINTGDGDDSATIGDDLSDEAIVSTGDGDDTVIVGDNVEDRATIDTGDGDDTVIVNDLKDDSNIDLGDGDDTLIVKEDVNLDSGVVTGGDGVDSLVLEDQTEDDWDSEMSSRFQDFESVTFSDGTILNLIEAAATSESEQEVRLVSINVDGVDYEVGDESTEIVLPHGTLIVNQNGDFNFVVDNDNTEVQSLNIGDSLDETFSYTLSNGIDTFTSSVNINIDGRDDAPVIEYTIASDVDSLENSILKDISITDVDNTTLENAYVSIDNYKDGDIINVGELPDGITATLSGADLVLSGTATLADYEAALKSLTFETTSEDTTSREFVYTVFDGVKYSNVESVVFDLESGSDVENSATTCDINHFTISTPNEHDISHIDLYIKTADSDIIKIKIDDFQDGFQSVTPASFIRENYPESELIAYYVKAGDNFSIDGIQNDTVILNDNYSLYDLPVFNHAFDELTLKFNKDYNETYEDVYSFNNFPDLYFRDNYNDEISNNAPEANDDRGAVFDISGKNLVEYTDADDIYFVEGTQAYQDRYNGTFLGDDVIYTKDGLDNVQALSGDDIIIDADGFSHLEGNDGNDILYGGAGNDTLYGGAGNDLGVYDGKFSDYTIEVINDTQIRVIDNNYTDGWEGFDIVYSSGKNTVERLQFADGQYDVVNGVFYKGVYDDKISYGHINIEEDTPTIINVSKLLANDKDIDGDIISIISVSNATHGSVELNENGDVLFIPEANYNGEASFTYTISDGELTDTATVTLNVENVNNAPEANDDRGAVFDISGKNLVEYTDADDIYFVEGTQAYQDRYNGTFLGDDVIYTKDGLDNVQALSGDDIIIDADGFSHLEGNDGNDILYGGAGNDTLYGGAGNDLGVYDGKFSDYTIEVINDTQIRVIDNNYTDGWEGFDIVYSSGKNTVERLQFADGQYDVVNGVFYKGVYDDKISYGHINIEEDTPTIINASKLLANDKDIDGDIISIISVSNATHGSVELNENGDVLFIPEANYNGEASFTYTISDGELTDTATVTLNITTNMIMDNDINVSKEDVSNEILFDENTEVDSYIEENFNDNNGFGNGDQEAPGNSLENNRAENLVEEDISKVGDVSLEITSSQRNIENVSEVSADSIYDLDFQRLEDIEDISNTIIDEEADKYEFSDMNTALYTNSDAVDIIEVNGNSNVIMTYGGDDIVNVDGNQNKAIDLGDGNNRIDVDGNSNSIYVGDGDDAIRIAGNQNVGIDLNEGSNQIDIYGDANNIYAGSGSNIINIVGNANGDIDVESGNDYVSIGGNSSNIDLGAGNDYIEVGGNVNGFIEGGEGIDSIVLNSYSISDWNSNIGGIQDKIVNFENIKFSDGTIIGDIGAFGSYSAITYYTTINVVSTQEDFNEELSSVFIEVPNDVSVLDSEGNPLNIVDNNVTVPLSVNLEASITIVSEDRLSDEEINDIKGSITTTEQNGDSSTAVDGIGFDVVSDTDDYEILNLQDGIDLDFSDSHLESLNNIDEINMQNGFANSIDGLTLDDVLEMTDENNTLTIMGDDVDSLNINKDGWELNSESNNNGINTYEYSNGNGDIVVLNIEEQIYSTGM